MSRRCRRTSGVRTLSAGTKANWVGQLGGRLFRFFKFGPSAQQWHGRSRRDRLVDTQEFESVRAHHPNQQVADSGPENSPPRSSCCVNRRYVYCGHGRQPNRRYRFSAAPHHNIRAPSGNPSISTSEASGGGCRGRTRPRAGLRRSNAAVKGRSGSGFSTFGRRTRTV